MHITRQALKKWTILVTVCGGFSLFFGAVVTQKAFIPMLLGMVTLIVMYAAIESSPRYQAKRGGNPLLARALDMGIRIRWVYGLVMPIVFINLENISLKAFIFLDMWIGMGAMSIVSFVTGLSVERHGSAALTKAETIGFAYHANVYLTTIVTGLIHTVILAALCGVIYGILTLKARYKAKVA